MTSNCSLVRYQGIACLVLMSCNEYCSNTESKKVRELTGELMRMSFFLSFARLFFPFSSQSFESGSGSKSGDELSKGKRLANACFHMNSVTCFHYLLCDVRISIGCSKMKHRHSLRRTNVNLGPILQQK